ncbi:MAG: hypothetical protein ACMUEM_04530 [Flavobacteriales bacterium AspAUS03]
MLQYIVIGIIFFFAVVYLIWLFVKTFSGRLHCQKACGCGRGNVDVKDG